MGAEATLQDSVTAGAGAVTSEASARRRRPRRPRDATRTFALTFLWSRSWRRSCRRSCARSWCRSRRPTSCRRDRTRRSCRRCRRRSSYQGKTYDIYVVPIDGVDRSLALCQARPRREPVRRPREPGRRARSRGRGRGGRSTGRGRSRRRGRTSPTSGTIIDFPRLLFNTLAIAIIGMIGTVVSCTLVAYGFARFRFPGRTPPVHAADRDDLPAVRGDPHPDVHDLLEDRLGGDVAAAARADVLRQRLRRVPRPPVHADDPARDGRGGRDRRRRPVPDAGLGDPAAGVAGDRGRRDLPPRLFVERLLRPADLPVDEARAPAARRRAGEVQRHPLPQPGATSRPAP